MDRLHLAHIGLRLSMCNLPPFDSGILCPTSKLNGVITFSHQVTQHLCLNNLSPQCKSHTCSRSAAGILSFIQILIKISLTIINYLRPIRSIRTFNVGKSIPPIRFVTIPSFRTRYGSHIFTAKEFFKQGYCLKNSPSRD
jgi:hypothetical protein